jgi:hypothetical protein
VRNFRFFLTTAGIIQVLTGLIHGLSLFISPSASNEKEEQLLELFVNYKQDMGAGYYRSMDELFTSISVCFTLLFLFGGLLNLYLLRKRADAALMTGILTLEVLIYGICFAVMLAYAFLPPIVLSGLVFITLLMSRATLFRNRTVAVD